MSPVELRRILAEWRMRVQRVKTILQPASLDEDEWRQFSQNLALLVREHGQSWIIDPNVYWDLRWNLQDGGSLVCQIEHIPGEKTSLVVAQNGGFATEVGSYTWLWAEFNMEGNFARDPYWVDGSWREALTALLLPLDRRSPYMLAGRAETPQALLMQPGARPNNSRFVRSLMPPYVLDPEGADDESSPAQPHPSAPPPAEETPAPAAAEAAGQPPPQPAAETPAESLYEASDADLTIENDPEPEQQPRRPAPFWAAMGKQGRLLRERARSRYARTQPRTGQRSPHREIR
jgi:hypothetical protein